MSDLELVVDLLAAARSVTFLTGAGMSAESGIPTFRDALTGLWARFDPMELATPEAFRRNPSLVFGWYLSRYCAIRDAVPHSGYEAIEDLARDGRRVTVVTQNVDGLHRRARGVDVIEVHGSLSSFRCADCDAPFAGERLAALAREVAASGRTEVRPPACESCGGPVRPGVVWFGEMLPPDAMQRAEREVRESAVLLVVGTSSVVYPAAGLPALARANGVPVVEVNPGPTPLSDLADFTIRDGAASALTRLADGLAARVQR